MSTPVGPKLNALSYPGSTQHLTHSLEGQNAQITTEPHESLTLSPSAEAIQQDAHLDQGIANAKGTGKALGNLKDGANDLAEFRGMDDRLKAFRQSMGRSGANLDSVTKRVDPRLLKNQLNGAQFLLGAKQIANGEFADGVENVSEAGLSLGKDAADSISKAGDRFSGLKAGARTFGKFVGRAPLAVVDGANDFSKFANRENKAEEGWFSRNKQAISGGLKVAGGVALGAALFMSGPVGWGVMAAGSALVGGGTAVEYSQEIKKGAGKVRDFLTPERVSRGSRGRRGASKT